MSASTSRSHWTVQKFSNLDAMRQAQVKGWQQLTGAQRRAAAWELVQEAWAMQKRNPDELRLQRAVTSVRRPGS